MHILIISTDKSLIGGLEFGDAKARHAKYGQFVDQLDIIAYSNRREGLKEFKISDNVTGHPSNSTSKLLFLFNAVKIGKKINASKKVDIIVCQDPFVMGLVGVLLKKKLKAKLQINFHGDFWDNSNWLKERFINFIFLIISKITVSQADAIRVMSEGQKEKLLRHNIESGKIHVISTPVDLSKYKVHDEAKITKLKKVGNPIILHIGRNDKVKDYPTLVKTFEIVHQKHPNAILWQVGAGLKYTDLDTDISEKNLKLDDRTSAEELISIIQASDMMVLSSTSESFGKVLVEAAACAKPLVATATTGAREIINNERNGYLVPVGDYKALAEKINYLIDNKDTAKQMGEAGKAIVHERFGDNTDKIITLWNKLNSK